jgi:glycosyl transferase family 25
MSELVTYLINLDRSVERLTQATSQLETQNVPFTRVQAFDGSGIDTDNTAPYAPSRSLQYFGRTMQGGEIGCFLSHVDCARRFLASGANYSLVLEDDIQLTAEFAMVLPELMEWLAQRQDLDWYLVNLGNPRLKIATQLHQFGSYTLFRAHYFPMTTTAILWSRAGAEEFLRQFEPIFAPIDNFFRHWLIGTNHGLAFYPPLATTTGSPSEIEQSNATKARKLAGRSQFSAIVKQRRHMFDLLRALRSKYVGS